MNIVFFGTPQFAVPSLERLIDHPGFTVVAVVTQPDKRRGRGTQLSASPVKQVAQQQQIPVWQPERIRKDVEMVEQLRGTQADAFVVVAYGQILPQSILDLPRLGCINAHGSLLPRYRGAAPIQWCLYHGEMETGITTMLMDAGMDTGPMLLERHTAIAPLENAHDLAVRLANLSAELLIETLTKLDQQAIQPIPQDHEQATYAPLIQKSDYGLDWSRPAIALHNQVRGFYPYCTTQIQGHSLKVLATVPLSSAPATLPPEWGQLAAQRATLAPSQAQPGTVVDIVKGVGPIIQTGVGELLLREVQPAGKRSQSGWDFANGTRLAIGDVLTTSSPT